jgi:hypothetical protein
LASGDSMKKITKLKNIKWLKYNLNKIQIDMDTPEMQAKENTKHYEMPPN